MKYLASLIVGVAIGPMCNAQPAPDGGAGGASDILRRWVSDAARTPSFEVEWEVPTRLLDYERNVRGEFLFREHSVFRWPCCFTAQGRVIQSAAGLPDLQAQQFEYDESIDAEGRHRKTRGGTGDFQEYDRVESLEPFLRARMIDAPHLLGLWLAEVAETTPANWADDGRIVAEVEGLSLRFYLAEMQSPRSRGEEGTWGVERLESLRKDGTVQSAWCYSALSMPSGFHVAVGTRRGYVSSSDSATTIPGSEATLVQVAGLDQPVDDVFVLVLGKATTTDPKTGEIKTADGDVVGIDQTIRRGRAPLAVFVGAAVALFVAVVVGWLLVRAR